MSESFEKVCTSYDDCTWIGRDGVKRAIDRLKAAHESEITEALCDACDQCDRMDKKAYEHEIEHLRKAEYHRGYVAGQRSMDADHAAVATRLRGLRFGGGSHENLGKIAYAIYPCATGWTCESCEGLRDKIIDLLGGVRECGASCGGCGAGCDGADSGGWQQEAVDVDDSVSDVRPDIPVADGVAAQVMYDVLGNERHKAVCELRKVCTKLDESVWTWIEDVAIAIGARDKQSDEYESMLPKITDRLIHLLGGDQPTLSDLFGIWQDGAESENKGSESVSEMTKSAETINLGDKSNGENHKIASITDELRKFKGHINTRTTPEMVLALRAEINCIADRIDERARLGDIKADIWQDYANQMRAERDNLLDLLRDARKEYMRLRTENQIMLEDMRRRQAKLDESEHERDELQAKLDDYDKTHVALPKDANDEYIHIGDVMDGYAKTIEVVELRYGRSGWVLISRDGNGYTDTFAFAHHHEPTVEQVIRDLTLGKITESQAIERIGGING